jgi:hypothetical protein
MICPILRRGAGVEEETIRIRTNHRGYAANVVGERGNGEGACFSDGDGRAVGIGGKKMKMCVPPVRFKLPQVGGSILAQKSGALNDGFVGQVELIVPIADDRQRRVATRRVQRARHLNCKRAAFSLPIRADKEQPADLVASAIVDDSPDVVNIRNGREIGSEGDDMNPVSSGRREVSRGLGRPFRRKNRSGRSQQCTPVGIDANLHGSIAQARVRLVEINQIRIGRIRPEKHRPIAAKLRDRRKLMGDDRVNGVPPSRLMNLRGVLSENISFTVGNVGAALNDGKKSPTKAMKNRLRFGERPVANDGHARPLHCERQMRNQPRPCKRIVRIVRCHKQKSHREFSPLGFPIGPRV